MVVPLAADDQGSGTPLVLLHAFPLSRAMLAPLAPLLPQARLITPDLRGFGASPLGTDPPDLDRMAEDVLALLDALGLERPVLGGVSMGGYVAMALLRLAPDRAGGLVLLDTKAGADAESARAARLATARQVAADGAAVLAPMLDALLGATTRATRPDVVAAVSGWIAAADPAGVAWAQRAMAARPDSFPTLAASQMPALVVVGDEDQLSPPTEAAAMVAALGDSATLVTVAQAGHLAALEQPTAVAAALTDFLADVG
jgi:pimeloyl-ACP methyl ester carboxylesterase